MDAPTGGELRWALVTASGLVFQGGTRLPVLRVHDIYTGDRIARQSARDRR